jgi:predicted Na+-dependent transporter
LPRSPRLRLIRAAIGREAAVSTAFGEVGLALVTVLRPALAFLPGQQVQGHDAESGWIMAAMAAICVGWLLFRGGVQLTSGGSITRAKNPRTYWSLVAASVLLGLFGVWISLNPTPN